jgi:lipoate-protein ligase A
MTTPHFVPQITVFDDSGLGREGALNMAIDEVLLGKHEQPWLRWYGWDRPTVSVGYFSKSPSEDGAWVRRWTGGGRVEHGGGLDFTFSIGVPRSYPESRLRADEAYMAIHSAVTKALRAEGHQATLASDPGSDPALPCFANPVPHDVLGVGGAKVAGGAQRRSRHGLLHQGSIQGLRLEPTFAEQFANHLGATVRIEALPTGLVESATKLADSKYRSEEWLIRVPA